MKMKRDRTETSSPRHPLPSESGGALLVAIIVILAITGIGLVTLAISADAARESRTAVVDRQAEASVEGIMQTVQQLVDNRAFASTLAQVMRTAGPDGELRQVNFGSEDTFPGATGDDVTFGALLLPRAEGVSDVHRRMDVNIRRGWPPRAIAGFEVGAFCRERFEITGRVQSSTVEDWENDREAGDRRAIREFRAYTLTPPVSCEEYQ